MTVTRSNLSATQISTASIAQLVKGELIGDGGVIVSGFSGIKEAKKNKIYEVAEKADITDKKPELAKEKPKEKKSKKTSRHSTLI